MGAPAGSRNCKLLKVLVGERGFEPPTPWSRTRCSTRLSHSPTPKTENHAFCARFQWLEYSRKQKAVGFRLPAFGLKPRSSSCESNCNSKLLLLAGSWELV